MISSEPSAEDLAVWQDALREQQAAEAELAAALEANDVSRLAELVRELDTRRTVADLLLAEAVSRARSAVHHVRLINLPALLGMARGR